MAPEPDVETLPTDAPPRAAGGYRWVICFLLFFATTINYVDRGVLGVLAPDLQTTIGWTDTQYGDINAAFSCASDMFPRRAVGSVIGIAGMSGAVGGILMQAASGRIKDLTGSYLAMFVVAGSVYVLSVLVIHGLVPRLSPAVLEARPSHVTGTGPDRPL